MPSGIYIRTAEHKHHLSKALIGVMAGEKNPNYGKKASEETLNKMSLAKKGKPNGLAGKKLSVIHAEKIRLRLIGNKNRLGVKDTPETKKRQSENRKGEKNPNYGNHVSLEGSIRIAEANRRRVWKETSKRKLRIARVKSVEDNNGIAHPNYSMRACEYFKKFDEENNTKGRYAVYGGGEFQIKELGYFVDYINFEKKLIIEWDDKKHFNKDGALKEQDTARQRQIQELYADFEFRRIKDEVMG